MNSDDLNKAFSMTSITRADLLSAGFSEAVVETLTDEDMKTIAAAMEDLYCDAGYWEDLELCAKRTLERKEEEADVEQDDQPTGDHHGLT